MADAGFNTGTPVAMATVCQEHRDMREFRVGHMAHHEERDDRIDKRLQSLEEGREADRNWQRDQGAKMNATLVGLIAMLALLAINLVAKGIHP